MPIPDLSQQYPEKLAQITETIDMIIAKWDEFGHPKLGEAEASWAGLTPKRAWLNGYAAGYADCADGLTFAMTEILEDTD